MREKTAHVLAINMSGSLKDKTGKSRFSIHVPQGGLFWTFCGGKVLQNRVGNIHSCERIAAADFFLAQSVDSCRNPVNYPSFHPFSLYHVTAKSYNHV